MGSSDFGFGYKPVKIKPMFSLSYDKPKKRRSKLTPAQRLYIWEHPNLYGRKCNICR